MKYGDEETNMIIGAENYQMGVEWFVIDGLAIGGGISYNTGMSLKQNVFTIMPTLTYYYAMDKLIPYIGVGFKYSDISDDPDMGDGDGYSIFGKLGLAYMLGNNLALFGEVQYSYDTLDMDAGDEDGYMLSGFLGVKAFF
jgi:hypothetical protein